MFNKSQAAMEFLMTYGWAILVVLAALAALAYFGVLSPDKFLPEKCILEPGLTCVSNKVEPTKITLIVANGLGRSLTIDSISIVSKSSTCSNTFTQAMQSGEDFSFVINNNGAGCSNGVQKEKFKGDITISYTEKDTALPKTMFGKIVTKIE